jgi:hypothetical protein
MRGIRTEVESNGSPTRSEAEVRSDLLAVEERANDVCPSSPEDLAEELVPLVEWLAERYGLVKSESIVLLRGLMVHVAIVSGVT